MDAKATTPTMRLLFILTLALLFSASTKAALFVVTDTNDSMNLTSLRGAIITANRIGRNNTIFLGANRDLRASDQQSTYRLTISGTNEDAARTGDLDITQGNLKIVGVGSNVTIDATGLGDRVFQVFFPCEPHSAECDD